MRHAGSRAFRIRAVIISVLGTSLASALVLALMQNAVAGVWVRCAVPNVVTGQVQILLNKAPGSNKSPQTAKVARFVVN